MDRGRVVAFAGGLAVGAAAVLLVVSLRGGSSTTASSASGALASGASPSTATGSSATTTDSTSEILALKTRIAELEADARAGAPANAASAPATVTPDMLEHGMSTSDAWWDAMKRDAAWDAKRKELVLDRLNKQLGIALDPAKVECKTRCCRIYFDDAVFDERSDEITSSVGLDFDMPGGWGTSGASDDQKILTKCWSREPSPMPIPDRAVERAALLAKAQPAIAKCGTPAPAITLLVSLVLDEQGQVAKVASNKAELNSPIAACAEAALLAAAAFAPAPMQTDVPIRVVLGK